MERDIFKPDNPEDRYLNRQAELLWGLTVEVQRLGNGTDPLTSGVRQICFEAYRYMMRNGEQAWANAILREAQTRFPTNLQNIQSQKVAETTH